MTATSSIGYVLVTPVRDEVAIFGRTLAAVTNQTIPPREWVIVSDGSTDGTDELVEGFARLHPWIRLIRLAPRQGRSFAVVVENTELGVRSLECTDYQYLGLLDADLDFSSMYFGTLLERFSSNSRLGLAGGVVIDPGRSHDELPRNRQDVPGAVQLFRRECFEQLGGLIALPEGGWDALTCAMARMQGFETKLMTDLVVDHLKPRNVSQGSPLRRLWQLGLRDYAMGYDPWFEFVKCLGRLAEPPALAAAGARWIGYCSGALRRQPRRVPAAVVAFVRQEQRARLRRALHLSQRPASSLR